MCDVQTVISMYKLKMFYFTFFPGDMWTVHNVQVFISSEILYFTYFVVIKVFVSNYKAQNISTLGTFW